MLELQEWDGERGVSPLRALYAAWDRARSATSREEFCEAIRAHHQESVDRIVADMGHDPSLAPIVRVTMADDPEWPDLAVNIEAGEADDDR